MNLHKSQALFSAQAAAARLEWANFHARSRVSNALPMVFQIVSDIGRSALRRPAHAAAHIPCRLVSGAPSLMIRPVPTRSEAYRSNRVAFRVARARPMADMANEA